MIGFAKYFKDGKAMSFKTIDNWLLKKYIKIWGNMSSLMNKKIKSEPVYGQSLINKNYRNFRTSDDVEIKPVAKRDQRNKTTTTNFTMRSGQHIVMSLSFFQFMLNLESSRSRISNV